MELQKTLRPLLMASAFLVTGAAQALSQGGLDDTTSTGTADITVTKNKMVQITVLQDIGLILNTSTNDYEGSTGTCIYSNGDIAYNIIANGDGGGGTAYSLLHEDSVETMDYTVDFIDGASSTFGMTATSDQAATNANILDPTCGGASNSSINVTVTASDFNDAISGDYAGTLSLIVSPIP